MVKLVIKRNGTEVPFDKKKIKNAIMAAMTETDSVNIKTANRIANEISKFDQEKMTIEEIQDAVKDKLMDSSLKRTAQSYIEYSHDRKHLRETNKVYESVLTLVDGLNDYLKEENSNKNATIASTQRDYMAGEVSKDVTMQFLLPADIREAHLNGIIHFHDMDYFAQHIHNCCLVNLEDMLQNGTVINQTLIERPHSFSTACNIATQIMAIVASGQYGGQSITLTHLAPFVDVSRKKIRNEVIEELKDITDATDPKIDEITENRLKKEIKRGVQTIQYQINTLNTSNG